MACAEADTTARCLFYAVRPSQAKPTKSGLASSSHTGTAMAGSGVYGCIPPWLSTCPSVRPICARCHDDHAAVEGPCCCARNLRGWLPQSFDWHTCTAAADATGAAGDRSCAWSAPARPWATGVWKTASACTGQMAMSGRLTWKSTPGEWQLGVGAAWAWVWGIVLVGCVGLLAAAGAPPHMACMACAAP